MRLNIDVFKFSNIETANRPTDVCTGYESIKFKFKSIFQNLPNKVCSGRFATFRLSSFVRSKLLPVSLVSSRGEAPLKPTVGPSKCASIN
jgi:hypothetical protein